MKSTQFAFCLLFFSAISPAGNILEGLPIIFQESVPISALKEFGDLLVIDPVEIQRLKGALDPGLLSRSRLPGNTGLWVEKIRLPNGTKKYLLDYGLNLSVSRGHKFTCELVTENGVQKIVKTFYGGVKKLPLPSTITAAEKAIAMASADMTPQAAKLTGRLAVAQVADDALRSTRLQNYLTRMTGNRPLWRITDAKLVKRANALTNLLKAGDLKGAEKLVEEINKGAMKNAASKALALGTVVDIGLGVVNIWDINSAYNHFWNRYKTRYETMVELLGAGSKTAESPSRICAEITASAGCSEDMTSADVCSNIARLGGISNIFNRYMKAVGDDLENTQDAWIYTTESVSHIHPRLESAVHRYCLGEQPVLIAMVPSKQFSPNYPHSTISREWTTGGHDLALRCSGDAHITDLIIRPHPDMTPEEIHIETGFDITSGIFKPTGPLMKNEGALERAKDLVCNRRDTECLGASFCPSVADLTRDCWQDTLPEDLRLQVTFTCTLRNP